MVSSHEIIGPRDFYEELYGASSRIQRGELPIKPFLGALSCEDCPKQ